MHLSYLQRHGYEGLIAIGDFAERALVQKPTIAAEKVVEYIKEHSAAPIIISGFRAPEEVAHLRQAVSPLRKEFVTLFIDADDNNGFQRLRARMRSGDNISQEEFRQRDFQQQRMGLEEIRLSEYGIRLRNDGSLSDYLANIDQTVGRPDFEEIDVRAALKKAAHVTDIRIEGAILIALLAVWRADELRPFFTTTEIAGLIRSTLPGIVPKHKDNVSRYFNQDFYVYYEIDNTSPTAVRKYRLSNTGYGRAVLELHQISRS